MKKILGFLFASGCGVPFTPVTRAIAMVLAIPLVLFQIWLALWATLTPIEIGVIFMVPMLIIAALTSGARPDSRSVGWFEYAMAVAVAVAGAYMMASAARYSSWMLGVSRFSTADLIAGTVMLLVVLVIMKRRVGPGMTAVVVVLLAYLFWGHHLGGVLYHRRFGPAEIVEQSIISVNGGLFGAPVSAAALYVYLFVVFGKILEVSGGGQFFFDLAARFAGRQTGGVAKVAVVSSGLFGMISGSPTSDIVTTGSVTIPMMKRLGYPAHAAAAIETVASVGGSFMPPVMGAVVFLMVEFTGISYADILAASIIVALLYYFAVMLQVHHYSAGHGFGAYDGPLPRLGRVLLRGWPYIIPMAVLVWLIEAGRPPQYAVVIATLLMLVLSWLQPDPALRLGPRRLARHLTEATAMMAPLIAAVAAAGLVEQVLNVTGLGSKLSFVMFEFADGNKALILVMAALVTVIFGMGMPVPAVYALAAILLAPGLRGAGFGMLEAHLFLVWFSVASHLTPPVAVASYVAATIAGSAPMRTSLWASRFGLLVFMLPFAFVLRPGLLGQGDWAAVAADTLLTALAILFLAPALVGYFRRPLALWHRLALFLLGALAMVGVAVPWLDWGAAVLGGVLLLAAGRGLAGPAPARLAG